MTDAATTDAWNRVQEMHRGDTAAHELGIGVRSADAGVAVATMVVGEQHLGSLGQVHGGVLFTLADVAMSYACNSRSGTSVAVRAAIDYVEGARLGEELVAEATEHSLRGKAGIYDVTVRTSEDDRLIATFRGNTLRVQ